MKTTVKIQNGKWESSEVPLDIYWEICGDHRRISAARDNSNDGKDLFVVVFSHRLLFLERYCVSCKENEAVRIPSPTLNDARAIGQENILPIEKREKEILSV
ncbi:hypothetical protein NPIL_521091 [Nephila pilipes]|uniref:Uncharacterized protein n=1 Tax=Nephila pilipes TaxID=299642 RepID=A0A8X6NHI0_NEPPI|nr:hypothetical protein NPIL_521091 [Nephila pilipes]